MKVSAQAGELHEIADASHTKVTKDIERMIVRIGELNGEGLSDDRKKKIEAIQRVLGFADNIRKNLKRVTDMLGAMPKIASVELTDAEVQLLAFGTKDLDETTKVPAPSRNAHQ